MAHSGGQFEEAKQYAPLRKVLNPVRHALLSHPTLERVAVAGRLIGDNHFWMGNPNSGSSIDAIDLIAGLMARAAELPDDGFRTASRELNAFLSPINDKVTCEVLGDLDEGSDMLLFYGLTIGERIDAVQDMAILPYTDVQRFVDEEFLFDLAPSGARCHDYRAVGALVRPFRWRPEFRRRARVYDSVPRSFNPTSAGFLDLLAVSHATPVVPLAELSGQIDRVAGRLLGRARQSPGIYQKFKAKGLNGFAARPHICAGALGDAREVFKNCENDRYRRLAPIIELLAEALARDGRFAMQDKIVDVAKALEGMYDLPKQGVTKALVKQIADLLGTDKASQDRIREDVRKFYNVRSAIVHNRPYETTPFTNDAVFLTGFDLARQTLFKLLRENPMKAELDR